MAFIEMLSTGWRQFLTALHPDSRQRLVEVLRDKYLDEAKDVVQFEDHARRMTYPHFQKRLLCIAEEEKAHVKWLQDTITALGGKIPQTTFTVTHGKNSWESLLMDIEEEKRDCAAILEQLYTVVKHADPEIAAGLRRIRDDEKRHRQEILDLLMKDDRFVDTVEKLRSELLPQRFEHLSLHLLIGGGIHTPTITEDQMAAHVRRHDDYCVFEIYSASVSIRQSAIIKDLQHDVKDIVVGLFDFVK